MTNSTYNTSSSIPLAAVMVMVVVLMPMPDDVGQTTPSPARRATPEIPPSYSPGNTGMTIRIQPAMTGDAVVDNYRPRTELGHRLLALRRAYLSTGGQLLNGDALDAEVQLRRGGIADA